MKLSEKPALKKEILALPDKEKDKLLLRLVAKDKVLTEHFHFILLEDEADLKERIESIKQEILQAIYNVSRSKSIVKERLILLRNFMKKINHFAKVTKKIPEEVELKIFLLNQFKIEFTITEFLYKNYGHLFANYFVNQTQLIYKKMDKLHPDLQFDLAEEINKILTYIFSGYLRNAAQRLNLNSVYS